MLGIRDWTSDTWTAIAAVVAFIALIQPWMLTVWRRFFRRGTVDIYESGTIEIGFSAFGPSIGLMGTLRSRNRDMFVHSATVALSNRENAEFNRRYEWLLFRNPKMVLGLIGQSSAEVAVQAPASFMVLTTQPVQYNVAFYDVNLFQSLLSITEKFKQDFVMYVDEHTDIDVDAQSVDAHVRNKLIRQMRAAHNKFSDTVQYETATKSFEEFFYWQAGTYVLTLNVHAVNPHKTFSKSWSFALLPADIENLRSNVPSVFEEIVQLPLTAPYSFAYPRYVSFPSGCARVLLKLFPSINESQAVTEYPSQSAPNH